MVFPRPEQIQQWFHARPDTAFLQIARSLCQQSLPRRLPYWLTFAATLPHFATGNGWGDLVIMKRERKRSIVVYPARDDRYRLPSVSELYCIHITNLAVI